jgi:hypothetical protein
MQLSMIILAFFCVILGVFPHIWTEHIVLPATSSIIGGYSKIQLHFYEPFSFLKDWIIVGIGLILLKIIIMRPREINKINEKIIKLNINVKIVSIMCSLTIILFCLKIIN